MIRSFAHALLALACLVAPTRAAMIVDETFADNERLTQGLPNSVQWTYGAHNATAANAFASLDASSGALVWDHTNGGNNSFSAIWAHFTPSGSPLSLAVGETMTLSFDVLFSGGVFTTSSGAFRFALFNSGGSRVTTDFAGANDTGISSGTAFSGWRGYEGQLPVNSSAQSGDFVTRERNLSASNGLFTSNNWTALSGSNVTEPLFAAGTTYPGALALTRTATGMQVQATINGVSTNVVTDTSSPFTSFDTISFFTLDGATHNITLDNVRVEVVPEPATLVLLLIAAFAACGMLLRRRG